MKNKLLLFKKLIQKIYGERVSITIGINGKKNKANYWMFFITVDEIDIQYDLDITWCELNRTIKSHLDFGEICSICNEQNNNFRSCVKCQKYICVACDDEVNCCPFCRYQYNLKDELKQKHKNGDLKQIRFQSK